MNRPVKIINFVCTDKATWYKVYDYTQYKMQPITSIKVKLRETSTANYFKYLFDNSDEATYMTCAVGFEKELKTKELWVDVPDVDGQTIEIELLYQ